MKRRPELPPVTPEALETMSVATIAVLLTEGRVTLGEATRELERRSPDFLTVSPVTRRS